jgi:hypothetical protein
LPVGLHISRAYEPGVWIYYVFAPPLLYFGKNLENTEFLAWKKNVKLLRGIRVA